MLLEMLDQQEEQLITGFRRHPSFARMRMMDGAEQESVLLQRRFLSFEFTKIFDLLIDGLEDSDAKICARQILREEYPDQRGLVASHRENLFEDLLRLGIGREAIFASAPTAATRRAAERTVAFARTILTQPARRQLRCMAMLRFWGEVLTAVEYFEYWQAFLGARFAAWAAVHAATAGHASHFYEDHITHDQRRFTFAKLPKHARLSHADKMAVIILRQLSGEDDAAAVVEVNRRCAELKATFYKQFV